MTAIATGNMTTIKCVTIGDGSVGKTCMLISYTTNSFPKNYTPTVFDHYSANLIVDGEAVTLVLWDTPGQMDYDMLRPLSYPETDVFIVCFAIDDRPTINNLRDKWCPEIKRYCPSAPIILVATKVDLRDRGTTKRNENHNEYNYDREKKMGNDVIDTNDSLISTKEGLSLREELQASYYVECSALTQLGLTDVFIQAVRAVIYKRKKRLKGPLKARGQTEQCCMVM